jgi:hypothetical protein
MREWRREMDLLMSGKREVRASIMALDAEGKRAPW